MNAWIFQSVPAQFDLRFGLRENVTDTWKVSRYRSQMRPGDKVFFWMGGPPDIRGVYGWGEILSLPSLDPSDDKFEVSVVYKRRLKEPLLVSKIQEEQRLRQMLILRAPFGTNFPLLPYETDALINLLPPEQRPRY